VGRFSRVDLGAIASQLGVDLDVALGSLRALYGELDRKNDENTRSLQLPCARGCSACCRDSVFLTPLEFFAAWDRAQRTMADDVLDDVVARGLALYDQHRELILALDAPPPAGAADHTELVAGLHYDCPMLDAAGACRVYEDRELYARMFGQSFNDDGGVYGCHLVGAHLAGKTVTLVRVRQAAKLLGELPLTFKRQVYPYYIHMLYG
jgi:Fe-S-cluster containining protein